MDEKQSDPIDLLLIEDNLSDVELTRRALTQVGAAITLHHAVDGVEAIDFLKKVGTYSESPTPDLILLDLNLPRMDGKSFLRAIRSDDQRNTVPVVILTTSNREQDVGETYELGANAYLVKPVDLHEFFEVIRKIHEFWFGAVTLPSA